jgi:electron transfer flavoprotein alpha subunit
VGDAAELPAAPELGSLSLLPARLAPVRRACRFADDVAAAAGQIDALLRAAGADSVVAVGAGAAGAVEGGRRVAARYGARLAVSRPQVEAGRAARSELVGASGATVAPAVYVALGISGALPHLVGMAGSGTVVAVNRDRGARLFDYADLGLVGDAAAVIDALLTLP